MKKVAVVTDTTACIPQEQVARYDIEIVPVQLIFEDKTYRDGIDISAAEFYARLRKASRPPTTASSSPELYLEAFQKASQSAEGILCITEPSRFSAMYDSASVAKEMAEKTLPDMNIAVLDCTTAAAGQGLVALAAAREAAKGHDLNEVKETAENVMARVNLFATLDTLHYLVKSGRVPQAAALVNTLLQIKPIFTLNHANARTVALPRTIESAMKRILKLMERNVVKGEPLHAAVMHADALDNAIFLRNRIASQFNCSELFITEFTPVMGVHTGPGLLGVAFYSESS
ncbi:MAG: DegV family protein [Dehalococcoidia bacterium]|jgi:DegV family protein with EDD domain|nr:MAG: DegV family protein [Dehalococcoidia bacterium]